MPKYTEEKKEELLRRVFNQISKDHVSKKNNKWLTINSYEISHNLGEDISNCIQAIDPAHYYKVTKNL